MDKKLNATMKNSREDNNDNNLDKIDSGITTENEEEIE